MDSGFVPKADHLPVGLIHQPFLYHNIYELARHRRHDYRTGSILIVYKAPSGFGSRDSSCPWSIYVYYEA